MTILQRRRSNVLLVAVTLIAALLPVVGSSAGAAPVRAVVVSAGHVDTGNYNLQYSTTARPLLENPAHWGATGFDVDSLTIKSETSFVDGAYLSDVDIFFDGWVSDPGSPFGVTWTDAELHMLEHWVRTGGVMIINDDSADADALADMFDAPSEGAAGSPYTATGSHPIVTGAAAPLFGAWTTLQTGGTIGHFGPADQLDAAWTPLAVDATGNVSMAVRTVDDGAVILTGDEGIWRTDVDNSVAAFTDNERAIGNIMAYAITETDDAIFRVTAIPHQTSPVGVAQADLADGEIDMETDGGADPGTVTWSDGGTLPDGLSIDADTGVISGTPTTVGPNTVTITAAASAAGVDDTSYTFDWNIEADTVPAPTDQAIDAELDSFVSRDICPDAAANNDPLVATLINAGDLPGSLSFIAPCTILGVADALTPTPVDIEYSLTDVDGDVNAPADNGTITINVTSGAPIARNDAIAGTVGTPITVTDVCANDSLGAPPTSFELIGALPAGLDNAGGSPAGCEISGTPTAPFSGEVDYRLTDDVAATSVGTISFDITAPATVPTAADDEAAGQVGQPFSYNVCTNDSLGNGAHTVSFLGAGLPSGLANTSQGGCLVNGVPTVAGDFVIDYRLTDGDGDDDIATLDLTIAAAAVAPAAGECRPDEGFSMAGPTPGRPTPGDSFGESLAAGDFDGDGLTDLAVGAPDDNNGKGSVTVFLAPCDASSARRYTQAGPVPGKRQANDHFGHSLAVGDFNGDAYDDLAIGVPWEDVAGTRNAGAVVVLYGSASGLSKRGGDLFTQRGAVPGANERGDKFGFSLAAGDFDGDSHDDLLIGVPYEDIGSTRNAGAVVMLLGSASGIGTRGSDMWSQKGRVADSPQRGDRFGYALAAGDFNDDGNDDASIGAPYEDGAGLRNVGSVHVLDGGAAGLSTSGQQRFRGTATGQRLGWRLATGDTGSDGKDDLVAGARAAGSRGQAHLFLGGPSGLSFADMADQSMGADAPERGDRYSSGVAIVDIDGDGRGEVVVGVAREDFPGAANAGAVHVIDVVAGRFDQAGEAFRTQGDPDVPGVLHGGARFGAAVAGGTDGTLFVGAPGARAASVDDAGVVAALGS